MKLAGYYSATKTFSPQTNGFPQPYTALQPQNAYRTPYASTWTTTLTPTLLLHFGAGLLHTCNPQTAPNYDQTQTVSAGPSLCCDQLLPLHGGHVQPDRWRVERWRRTLPGRSQHQRRVHSHPHAHDTKPTFNTNVTWVKGNHTYKLGATALFEGIQSVNASRADGQYGFSAIQTSDPWQNGQPFANTASSGFPYASFLLGATNSVATAAPADVRLGTHAYGFYAQDSWKVTRKLTLDLGLRYDWAILWKEQYGRMQNAAFDKPNTLIGGRLGTVVYGATCNCNYANAYPFAFGPHIGVAYQINDKTVFRGGGAISYAATSDQAGLNSSAGDFYLIPPSAYGASAGALAAGDPLGPGNAAGNPVVHWPNFAPNYPVAAAPGVIPPSSPFVSIAPNTGRLPRTFQWSLGFQRQITRDMVVDVNYVGNRGAWWVAPLLGGLNYNALTPEVLKNQYGLDVTNRTDTTLLNTQINSPNVIARFPYLANPNAVYPGFPNTQTLLQALRPYPQWNGIPPFLGPPNGNTWYDSLQIKGTQRYSHGLSMQVAYTWQKELTNGTNSNTSYVTPSPPLINDVFNKPLDKQISGFSVPQLLIISFNYQTPKLHFGDSGGAKTLSWIARDWTYSGVLRYSSGQLIQSPDSANNLLSNLARGPANNPALWGGGYTFMNRVAGQPLFLVDPNSKFDPTKQLALNPAAWVEPPYGTFGASAPYFNDYRWQRQPSESMAFGRVFAIKERYKIQIRAEFQNIFNRLFYSVPTTAGATTTVSPTGKGNSLSGTTGLLSSGWGYVNWLNGAGALPRSGQVVARFTF